MALTFKQEVVLALLNNIESWLVPLSSPQAAAEYAAENVPEEGDMSAGILLQQKVIALQAAEQADEILRVVGK